MQKRPLDFQLSDSPPPVAATSPYRAAPSVPVADLRLYADDWINSATARRQSPATIEGKREAIAKLFWYLNRVGVVSCGPRELQSFVVYIADGHNDAEGRWGNSTLKYAASDRTIQYYAKYVKGFCRWMMKDFYVPLQIDLAANLEFASPKQAQIEPFSLSQLMALFHAAKKSLHPKRDEAILWFMFDTGIRATELCELVWSDIEIHHGYGHAKVLGKGNKERTIPFGREASRALWRYVAEQPRGPQCPVFQTDRGKNGQGAAFTRWGLLQLYVRLGEVAALSGVRCSPHTMRHTFAINYLRRGGELFTLQAVLGHEDLKMTQRYCKLAEVDLMNGHQKFSPADGLRAALKRGA